MQAKLKRQADRRGARRRVRTRSALFLWAFSALGLGAVSLVARLLPALSQGLPGFILGAAGTLLFIALPAYLGLFQIDGDQRHLIMTRKLSGAQALWVSASGALLVCPSLLLSLVIEGVLTTMGLPPMSAQGTLDASLFLPMLLASGVIAPVCEELYFRGYMLGVFGRLGRGRAAAATALLFAALHGPGLEMPVYIVIGLLFALLAYRTDSVFAPVLAHMAYNTTLLLLAFSGAGAPLAQLSPLSGALLLAGSAGFIYTMKRAYLARGTREAQGLTRPLSRRESAWLFLALILVIAAQIITGVTGL